MLPDTDLTKLEVTRAAQLPTGGPFFFGYPSGRLHPPDGAPEDKNYVVGSGRFRSRFVKERVKRAARYLQDNGKELVAGDHQGEPL